MNHYQKGYLSGLNNEAPDANPLSVMVTQFKAGLAAKLNNTKFTEALWVAQPLTFREGYKSKNFAHLDCKGKMLINGFEDWLLGHASGLNKMNNTIALDVHSAAFTISIETQSTYVGKKDFLPFVQHYTYLDHRNEVYRIEALHRYGLTSSYPHQHRITETPCLPGGLTALDVHKELGLEVLFDTHDILQSSSKGYQPITVQGVNFVYKSFQKYVKMLLDIPQWNIEASKSVPWDLELPVFES
jgi:hypothetical protein